MPIKGLTMTKRAVFKGGPWDGIEVKADYLPGAIGFRDLEVHEKKIPDQRLTYEMATSLREYHQYLLNIEPLANPNAQFRVGIELDDEPEQGQHLSDAVKPHLFDTLFHWEYQFDPNGKPWWE